MFRRFRNHPKFRNHPHSFSVIRKVTSGLGQAAGAGENRQHQARIGILQALSRLGIPLLDWPDFIQAYYTASSQRTTSHQLMFPEPFQPPPFDRLNETAELWTKRADLEWQRHRNRFLQTCEFWIAQGVDEKIPVTKLNRGPGKAQPGRKRQNTAIERRYEWAAMRLCRKSWKEIAFKYQTKESTVIKAATDVLRTAGWLTRPKASTSSTPAPYTHQEFPKWKYHRSEPARIVEDAVQESALGQGWADAPQES